jgi:hypothetical protein
MAARMCNSGRTKACLLLVIAFVIPACGRTPVSSSSAPPSASDGPVVSAPPAEVRAALLKPGDVDATWTTKPQDDSEIASYPTLCGTPNVDQRYPDAQRSNAVLVPAVDDPEAPVVGEFVWVYDDQEVAQHAFAAVADGYTCRKGTFSGGSFAVDPLDDVGPGFEADEVRGWRVDSRRTNTVYLWRVRNLVALLSFSSESEDAWAKLSDRQGLARLAVSRLHTL